MTRRALVASLTARAAALERRREAVLFDRREGEAWVALENHTVHTYDADGHGLLVESRDPRGRLPALVAISPYLIVW